jgi:phytoene dehydrogenase-like protein
MPSNHYEYDAIIVGAGPNGLAAAITLQQAGLSVWLLEGHDQVGGGARSAALTVPLFVHDVCSAVHPLAAASPFFASLPLNDLGLHYLYPDIDAAHPFADGSAAILTRSVAQTADSLGEDASAYLKWIQPVVDRWERLVPQLLAPLHGSSEALVMARFGWKGFSPALRSVRRFEGKRARAFCAGMAAHSFLPLTYAGTTAFALVLLAAGHCGGWPVIGGGSARLSEVLATYFQSLGGRIQTGTYVTSLKSLPASRVVLLDVTPRQLLNIAGDALSPHYIKQLNRYRYGPGVFKVDWALREPIPFTAPACRKAGTVHLGNSCEEIAQAEERVWSGGYPPHPFVLLAQPSILDPTRAPRDRHTAWAYCHVPQASSRDMTQAIEDQIERFAPGFRDCILARHTMSPLELEAYNPNYIGGDIQGGTMQLGQLFTRPVLRMSPYRTSAPGIYLCSSSTPPGGGVHGMCGYHAARRALRDVFDIRLPRTPARPA